MLSKRPRDEINCGLDALIKRDKEHFKRKRGDSDEGRPSRPDYQSKYRPPQPTELSYKAPEISKDQAEELRKKRLEKFGPVDPTDLSKPESQAPQQPAPHQHQAREGGKKQMRCRHYPNCNKSAGECEYHHPSEECKFFPKCNLGTKCMFVHPEIQCRFGDSCTRMNCAYKHSKQRQQLMMMNPLMLMQMPMMMMGMGGKDQEQQ